MGVKFCDIFFEIKLCSAEKSHVDTLSLKTFFFKLKHQKTQNENFGEMEKLLSKVPMGAAHNADGSLSRLNKFILRA